MVDLAGLQAELARLSGQPVLVNFWATWCAPCVEEMPELAQVAGEFRSAGLVVIGVSYDQMIPGVTPEAAVAAVAAYQDQANVRFPMLIFRGQDYDEINAALRLPGPVPVTLAFSPGGREVARVEAETDLAGFRALARAALAQP